MQVIHHRDPKLSRPIFKCDNYINPLLKDNPMLRHMNLSFACAMVGPARSGKTSLMTSLIATKYKKKQHRYKPSFRNCFRKIFLFMPEESNKSMADSPFDDIPEDQRWEHIDADILKGVYEECKSTKDDGHQYLMIIDDMQDELKEDLTAKMLLRCVSNRRHINLSIIFLVQNYISISKQVRLKMSDIFIFNPSPPEVEAMQKELSRLGKKHFEMMMGYYEQKAKEDEHTFLYIHEKGRVVFINHDEATFK